MFRAVATADVLIPGHATRAGTENYTKTFGAALPAEHYSEFLNLHLKLSSLGIGTFPGAASDEIDGAYAEIVHRAPGVVRKKPSARPKTGV